MLTPANIEVIDFKYLGVGLKKIFMEKSDYGVTIRIFKCAKCHVEYHPSQTWNFLHARIICRSKSVILFEGLKGRVLVLDEVSPV